MLDGRRPAGLQKTQAAHQVCVVNRPIRKHKEGKEEVVVVVVVVVEEEVVVVVVEVEEVVLEVMLVWRL